VTSIWLLSTWSSRARGVASATLGKLDASGRRSRGGGRPDGIFKDQRSPANGLPGGVRLSAGDGTRAEISRYPAQSDPSSKPSLGDWVAALLSAAAQVGRA